MGIKGLMKLLSDHAPDSVKERTIQSYFNRVVAIDASMSLYQFLIAIRSGPEGEVLTNEAGEVTSHLQGMFYRTIRMLDNGIKPVFVFGQQRTCARAVPARVLLRLTDAFAACRTRLVSSAPSFRSADGKAPTLKSGEVRTACYALCSCVVVPCADVRVPLLRCVLVAASCCVPCSAAQAAGEAFSGRGGPEGGQGGGRPGGHQPLHQAPGARHPRAQRGRAAAAAPNGRPHRGGAQRGRGAVRRAGQARRGVGHSHGGHGRADIRQRAPPPPHDLQRGAQDAHRRDRPRTRPAGTRTHHGRVHRPVHPVYRAHRSTRAAPIAPPSPPLHSAPH